MDRQIVIIPNSVFFAIISAGQQRAIGDKGWIEFAGVLVEGGEAWGGYNQSRHIKTNITWTYRKDWDLW